MYTQAYSADKFRLKGLDLMVQKCDIRSAMNLNL